MSSNSEKVIADTRAWLERAVIGLNLCPFAKAVHVKGLVHLAVSPSRDTADLLDDFITITIGLREEDVAGTAEAFGWLAQCAARQHVACAKGGCLIH